MVPYLHQGNIDMKRKLPVWRDQKCIPLLSAKTPLTSAGHQTTPSQGSRYRAENGNLRKLGWTYRHGTVFAPEQYLYQKETTAMERRQMYSTSLCKTPLTCVGRQTIPSQGSRCRPENGKLRKYGWTYHHGTVFAPKQYLFQKKAMGMERPETCSSSLSKNPSYLCGPSNYLISRQ